MWQGWIVGIVIVAAVGYAARRIYINFRKAKDPCYGCSGCALKDMKRQQMKKNNCCCEKK